MKILILCHSFNSLSQRLHCELAARGHELSVEFDINDHVTREAVALFAPDLVLAPFLKRAIPDDLCTTVPCLVVHPGPPGDAGPSALDWAILKGESEWGVTVLQATPLLDGGPVWASRTFATRAATKSSLYRHEVTEAAVAAVLAAVAAFEAGEKPVPLGPGRRVWRNSARQADRAIDWQADDMATVLRKIASADGMPGVRDELFGLPLYLFDARAAGGLRGKPGDVIARSGPAIARATRDGAVWIGHVKETHDRAIKLPATMVLAGRIADLPEIGGYNDIWYEEEGGAGFLHFPFYNGAMGTMACERLRDALHDALARPARVLVLCGGPDHWSNGLDLNRIEASHSPADESWRNINAMDDLAESIIEATGKYVVSAVGGNAGAGGVFLARAADEVWLRAGAVLNPHYKDMGNLFGSEYWTYLLPRHAGAQNARRIAETRLPMGSAEALGLGIADQVIDEPDQAFFAEVRKRAAALAAAPELAARLERKTDVRRADEGEKPLASYREHELAAMRRNFYGFDPSYHVARFNFVHKVAKSRTPLTIARHRSADRAANMQRRAAS